MECVWPACVMTQGVFIKHTDFPAENSDHWASPKTGYQDGWAAASEKLLLGMNALFGAFLSVWAALLQRDDWRSDHGVSSQNTVPNCWQGPRSLQLGVGDELSSSTACLLLLVSFMYMKWESAYVCVCMCSSWCMTRKPLETWQNSNSQISSREIVCL